MYPEPIINEMTHQTHLNLSFPRLNQQNVLLKNEIFTRPNAIMKNKCDFTH